MLASDFVLLCHCVAGHAGLQATAKRVGTLASDPKQFSETPQQCQINVYASKTTRMVVQTMYSHSSRCDCMLFRLKGHSVHSGTLPVHLRLPHIEAGLIAPFASRIVAMSVRAAKPDDSRERLIFEESGKDRNDQELRANLAFTRRQLANVEYKDEDVLTSIALGFTR